MIVSQRLGSYERLGRRVATGPLAALALTACSDPTMPETPSDAGTDAPLGDVSHNVDAWASAEASAGGSLADSSVDAAGGARIAPDGSVTGLLDGSLDGQDGAEAAPMDGGSDGGAAVSFTSDLMPLFQSSCSTSQGLACHGDLRVLGTVINGLPNQPRPYFGPFPGVATGAVVAQVYQGIVNVASNEAPTIAEVQPGAPSESFLWDKVDDDLTSILSKCTSGMDPPCGLAMPSDTGVLSSFELHEIQRWIEAGAPQN